MDSPPEAGQLGPNQTQAAGSGRAVKRAMLLGAAVVVVGACAFGIYEAVGSSSKHPPSATPPGGQPSSVPTLAGGLGSLYLATTSNAVVSIQFTPATNGYGGTAMALTTAGSPSRRTGSFFVISGVAATVKGNLLDIGFNGHSETSTTLSAGTFRIDFPLSSKKTVKMTFRAATTQEINAAQAAFRKQVQPRPG